MIRIIGLIFIEELGFVALKDCDFLINSGNDSRVNIFHHLSNF